MSEKKKEPLEGLIGLLSHLAPARPVSVEEMNEAIRLRACRKARRVAGQWDEETLGHRQDA